LRRNDSLVTPVSKVLSILTRLPPAWAGEVAVERDVPAKMSDGAVLLADRWHPVDQASGPVVLLRCPYGRRQLSVVGTLFAERGYQCVIQSTRGTFGSQGEWLPFRNERADGRETLDWISTQPWFGGKLATFGPSYLGLTQYAVLDRVPEYLHAMAVDVSASSFGSSVIYPSGVLALESMVSWVREVEYQESGPVEKVRVRLGKKKALRAAFSALPVSRADVAAVGHEVGFFQEWIAHELPDEGGDGWWDAIDFGPDLLGAPPTSFVGGWYDIFLPGQIADYRAMRAAGRVSRLTIGPWTHVKPGGLATMIRDGMEWFDSHMRGSIAGAPDKVRVFVMGSRRWVELPDWPPQSVEQSWYLQGDGGLSVGLPVASAPDRFRFDPSDPTPSVGGASIGPYAGKREQRPRELRHDVMTYTSDPMAADLTVIGQLLATIHLRSSLEHTDVFVRLCDVSPKGRSINLSDGIFRLRPGRPDRDADGAAAVRVEMWPTAHTFRRGHRIRLQVSSGAFPLFARNTGTGEPLKSAATLRVAEQEIFHDPDHPSAIALPVCRLRSLRLSAASRPPIAFRRRKPRR
jgi:putative CocE/NonD family hydrolase